MTELAAVAGVAASVTVAPISTAEPAVPANCFVASVLYCDQPLQPDGSWIRCYRTQPIFNSRGRVIPAVKKCGQVWPDAIPVGPRYHIGDQQPD